MSATAAPRSVAATDMPDLRRRLALAFEGNVGKAMVLSLNRESHDEADEAARVFSKLDVHTMRNGELFHIDRVLVELAAQAGEALGDYGFAEWDLPASSGVAYLDADVVRSDAKIGDFAERLLITWQNVPVMDAGDFPHGALRLTFYVDRAGYIDVMSRWDAAPVEQMRTHLPEFVYDGAQWLRYDDEAARVDTGYFHSIMGADPAVRKGRSDMFRALCYLLRQRVTSETTAELSRAERRRARREGVEPPRVRVISLASRHGGGSGEGSRDYVHQWMVRGHWRKQWYPSIQANRPIFIAPYVKGPDGAPMLGGEKVYRATALASDPASLSRRAAGTPDEENEDG